MQRYLHAQNTSLLFYGAESCCQTSDLATDMSVDRGVQMYSWYAELSHRPSVLIKVVWYAKKIIIKNSVIN